MYITTPNNLGARLPPPVTAFPYTTLFRSKIPKTKPPTATEAIRVTAMISTVAMIGEMALRLRELSFETGDMGVYPSDAKQSLSGFRHYWATTQLHIRPQDRDVIASCSPHEKPKYCNFYSSRDSWAASLLLPGSRHEKLCAVGQDYCPCVHLARHSAQGDLCGSRED